MAQKKDKAFRAGKGCSNVGSSFLRPRQRKLLRKKEKERIPFPLIPKGKRVSAPARLDRGRGERTGDSSRLGEQRENLPATRRGDSTPFRVERQTAGAFGKKYLL